MSETRPKFRWGQRVAAAADLYNDGSHPAAADGALLVPQGRTGEVVQVGQHVETGLAVYLVDFAGPVVGCLEQEIVPAIPEPAAAAGSGA